MALARALLRNARADQVVEGRPLVSVVLATYNWSSVLRYSIRSALWQTYPSLELIVVGDGCTDDSEQVVASFGDRRVRWHNLESNSGSQAIPNNKGLELANGKYVAYLGHDDVWHPKHLATMLAHLQRESADFAYGLAEVLGPSGSGIRTLSGLVQPPFPLGTWLPPTSFVHETALARRIGGWRTWEEANRAPDMDFLGRMQGEATRVIQVPAMTAFKFPAALRSNVYRERPSHEQRAYVTRIERERLFLERELAALALARVSPRGKRSRREKFASLVRMEPEELKAYLRRVRGLD